MQPKAIIFVAPGVEDTEFAYPYYRLQEEGFAVDVASKGAGPVSGKWGLPITANVDIEQVKPADYTITVVPGGHEAPDRLRQMPAVLEFLRVQNSCGRIITTVCHGPWVLISAGIVRGRRMTCYPGCRDDSFVAVLNYVHPVFTKSTVHCSYRFANKLNCMSAKKLVV
jgi:protease I